MPSASAGEVTRMLRAWSAGDPHAQDELLALVYGELRQRAAGHLRRDRQGHTLQPTALVHEAYLRLVGQRRVSWQNRGHFFALASQMMRRILVDHARAHSSDKRGGAAQKLSLEDAPISIEPDSVDLLALDEALSKLAAIDPRKERVIELMYFAGLDQKETAAVLAVSEKTVQRDWQMAKLWLLRELSAGG